MKLIVAVVKPFKVAELVDAFRSEPGFPGMTVLQGGGFGREWARPHQHSPTEDLSDFSAHNLILVGVSDEQAEAIIERIAEIAHTGQPGDGKLFVVPLDQAIALRTGERDEAALS